MTDADRKLLALGVKCTEFSVKELHKALEFLIQALKTGVMPTQQKSYADFQHSGGVPLLNVTTEQKETKDFIEISRKNGVNVSLKHNQGNGTYYLCLQGQQKNIELAAKQYQSKIFEKGHSKAQASLLARLEQAKVRAVSSHAQERSIGHGREHSGKER